MEHVEKSTITPELFTLQILEHLQGISDEITFEIEDTLNIKLTYQNGSSGNHLLNPLFACYNQDRERFEIMLNNMTHQMLCLDETVANIQEKNEVEQIFPVLKHSSYRDAIIEQLKAMGWDGEDQDAIPLVCNKLTDSLMVQYVVDSETSTRALLPMELAKLEIESTLELHNMATHNLAKYFAKVEPRIMQLAEGVYQLVADQHYEVSAVFIQHIWLNFPAELKGEIVVFVPARELIYITGSEDETGLLMAAMMALDAYKNASHPITEEPLVFKETHWQKFEFDDSLARKLWDKP